MVSRSLPVLTVFFPHSYQIILDSVDSISLVWTKLVHVLSVLSVHVIYSVLYFSFNVLETCYHVDFLSIWAALGSDLLSDPLYYQCLAYACRTLPTRTETSCHVQ